ncbi:hypothetical protein LTR85_004924 [Meristemomyces frigidus]|nr:hypothetical protein LTR85_004924 [Meristemomyces frigidus]
MLPPSRRPQYQQQSHEQIEPVGPYHSRSHSRPVRACQPCRTVRRRCNLANKTGGEPPCQQCAETNTDCIVERYQPQAQLLAPDTTSQPDAAEPSPIDSVALFSDAPTLFPTRIDKLISDVNAYEHTNCKRPFTGDLDALNHAQWILGMCASRLAPHNISTPAQRRELFMCSERALQRMEATILVHFPILSGRHVDITALEERLHEYQLRVGSLIEGNGSQATQGERARAMTKAFAVLQGKDFRDPDRFVIGVRVLRCAVGAKVPRSEDDGDTVVLPAVAEPDPEPAQRAWDTSKEVGWAFAAWSLIEMARCLSQSCNGQTVVLLQTRVPVEGFGGKAAW